MVGDFLGTHPFVNAAEPWVQVAYLANEMSTPLVPG